MKKQKKDFVCELDALRAAFAKVNLREAVAPVVRGKIVDDEDTYNKVQQLLDCPDMEHAHQFLLDVDFEDIDEQTKQKIDDLYQLAISQGYLKGSENQEYEEDQTDVDSDEGEEANIETDEQEQVSDVSGGFENGNASTPEEVASKDSIGMNAPTLGTVAFTLFYSAMKNGEIRTGECYSNATTMENAKLDAIQKLQKLGFTAIEIIAAEECDPNAKGAEGSSMEFGASVGDAPAEQSTEIEQDTVSEAEDKEPDNKKSEEDAEDKQDSEEQEKSEDDADKELSHAEKLDYFKRYLEEFKSLLKKMKSETYADMELADRAKFYDEMAKVWAGKPDPSEFMSDDNVKQIEHMKIKLDK